MTASRRAAAAISIASMLCCFSATAAWAGKPGGGGSSGDPQVAYRLPDGKGSKLVVSTEAGANQMTLYKTSKSFTFDLAPRGQQQVAIVDGATGRLKLLHYSVNSGVYVPGAIDDLGPAGTSGAVDFSPDGTKIAYVAGGGESNQLMVYDLATGQSELWSQGPYYWDIAWFRGGSSIAYATLLPREVNEVAGPGAAPQLLYSNGQGELNIDASRVHAGRLVISYNDMSGAARIGLWESGSLIASDLANSARSWQGTLNCDDSKLAYMGVQNTSGSQAFYIRELNTGVTTLVSRNSNVLLQFWPTCS